MEKVNISWDLNKRPIQLLFWWGHSRHPDGFAGPNMPGSPWAFIIFKSTSLDYKKKKMNVGLNLKYNLEDFLINSPALRVFLSPSKSLLQEASSVNMNLLQSEMFAALCWASYMRETASEKRENIRHLPKIMFFIQGAPYLEPRVFAEHHVINLIYQFDESI